LIAFYIFCENLWGSVVKQKTPVSSFIQSLLPVYQQFPKHTISLLTIDG
jgi:hypothetical protein